MCAKPRGHTAGEWWHRSRDRVRLLLKPFLLRPWGRGGGLVLVFPAQTRAWRVTAPRPSGPLAAVINKVLLGQSHAHSFPYCRWLFPHDHSRVKWWQKRLAGPTKSELFTLRPFKKKLATP